MTQKIDTYRSTWSLHNFRFRVVFWETKIDKFDVSDVLLVLKKEVLRLDVSKSTIN